MTITFTRSDLARKTSIELSGLFHQVSRSIKATQRDLVAAQSLLRVNGARKSGHMAFEKCTRRRPKSVPQGVISGAWKGPPRGPFPCAAAVWARSGVKYFTGVGVDGLGGFGGRIRTAALAGR